MLNQLHVMPGTGVTFSKGGHGVGLPPSWCLRNVLEAQDSLLLSRIMVVNISLFWSSCIVSIWGIHHWQHIICLLRAFLIFQFHYLFCTEENPWNQHTGTIPLLPWIRLIRDLSFYCQHVGVDVGKAKVHFTSFSWIESMLSRFHHCENQQFVHFTGRGVLLITRAWYENS